MPEAGLVILRLSNGIEVIELLGISLDQFVGGPTSIRAACDGSGVVKRFSGF
jgi:hypothetical protein